MKKIILICIALVFLSCKHNTRDFVISDFSEVIIDTLKPIKKVPYSAAILEISGYSNDTVLISFYNYDCKLRGNFKRSFNMDYYGGFDVGFKFDPYKATDGKIHVKYSIQ